MRKLKGIVGFEGRGQSQTRHVLNIVSGKLTVHKT